MPTETGYTSGAADDHGPTTGCCLLGRGAPLAPFVQDLRRDSVARGDPAQTSSASEPRRSESSTLYARTRGLLSEITEVGDEIGAGLTRPRRWLRISAPLLISHVVLGRIATELTRAYPEVRIEITAEGRLVDLAEEGYDLVIRINPLPNHGLVGRRFLWDELLVVAPASLACPTAPRRHAAGRPPRLPGHSSAPSQEPAERCAEHPSSGARSALDAPRSRTSAHCGRPSCGPARSRCGA